MLRSSLSDYSDAYILLKGTVTVPNTVAQVVTANNGDKRLIFKTFASFTNCISRINNMQVDDAHSIDKVMPIYNLIEYSDNYSKTSGILWQYCGDEPALNANNAIVDLSEANDTTNLFKLKKIITGNIGDGGSKSVEIMVPLKYLSTFGRTLEIPLIDCEIDLELHSSKKFFIVASNADQETTFSITDTKIYVPVVTLSTQDNTIEQLKCGFERTIN